MNFIIFVALLVARCGVNQATPFQKNSDEQTIEFKSEEDHLFPEEKSVECKIYEACRPPWVYVAGSCLFTDLTSRMSWSAGRIFCKEKYPTADLATFKDANEFAEILRHIFAINSPLKHIHFWIGGQDVGNNDNWRWITGEPMPLGTPFWGGDIGGSKQPNPSHNEPCAILWYNNRYYIHDVNCNIQPTTPLCQYRTV